MEAGVMSIGEIDHRVREWKRGLLDMHARITSRFRLSEHRLRSLRYLQALLGPAERKNDWHIAQQGRGTDF